MFNMGFSELVVLAIIGLLVVGPEQLPGVARKIARLLNEFKRATDEVLNPVETAKRSVDQYLNRQMSDLNNFDKEINAKLQAKLNEPELPKGTTDPAETKIDKKPDEGSDV